MQIWGFNHDDLQSGGKAGITFGTKNLMANVQQMNVSEQNYGSFVDMSLCTYLNSTVFNGMSQDLQNAILEARKRTSAGGGSKDIQIDALKIWVPSINEVDGNKNSAWVADGEGSKYAIFSGNSSRVKKLKNGGGLSREWWTRSPNSSRNSSRFCYISTGGVSGQVTSMSTRYGVCFGFCV